MELMQDARSLCERYPDLAAALLEPRVRYQAYVQIVHQLVR